MVNQVFPEPYGINSDAASVVDAYGATAFEPPSEEPDYLFSVLEYIAVISKTLDTGAIVVTAIPVATTVYLPTPTIDVSAVAISTSVSTYVPATDIDVEAIAVGIVFGPINLATASIDIEAEAVTPLVGPTYILCVTPSITIEALAIETSEADQLPTAAITVEAIPISMSIATTLPDVAVLVETYPGEVIIGIALSSAAITVEAIPIKLSMFLDTAHIDIEGIPGHTGEVTVLTTAHINVEYGLVYPCVEFELPQDSWLTLNLYRSDPGEIPPPDPEPPPDDDPDEPPGFDDDMYIGVENPSIGRFELAATARAIVSGDM